MYQDKTEWIGSTRIIAKRFIEKCYPDESSLFTVFWEAFASRIHVWLSKCSSAGMTANMASDIVAEVSFAKGNSLDLVTPITLMTLTEVMHKIDMETVHPSALEAFIGQSAARFGAGPGLTATLVRHLPTLCMEVLAARTDVDEALVSIASRPQYHIWTNGGSKIVRDIGEYEKLKNDYLFWIDLDEKSHISVISENRRIGPEAIRLLRAPNKMVFPEHDDKS